MNNSHDKVEKICINCGKSHYNKCTDPITSVGIITIQFDNNEICEIFKNITPDTKIMSHETGIKFVDTNDISIFAILQRTIKFLIICRRFTLGFSEFVRGRYSINDVMEISHLFQQMTKEEIYFGWIHKRKYHIAKIMINPKINLKHYLIQINVK